MELLQPRLHHRRPKARRQELSVQPNLRDRTVPQHRQYLHFPQRGLLRLSMSASRQSQIRRHPTLFLSIRREVRHRL